MKISVENFCSIRRAELDLPPGISVLSGKNGSGKTQLLVAAAAQGREPNTLSQAGYRDVVSPQTRVTVETTKILYRPSLRRVGLKARDAVYSTDTVGADAGDIRAGHGYTWNLDARYERLQDRLAPLFLAAGLRSSPEATQRWQTVVDTFSNAFDRTLEAKFDPKGTRIGVKLPSGELTPFASMSTGELEVLALVCDLVLEDEVELFLVDELDAHFHPDLQRKVIDTITPLVGSRRLLMSTHSPIVMLSVPPEHVFFLSRADDASPAKNQVASLRDDVELFSRIAELYPGFVEDSRLATRMQVAVEKILLTYAAQCLRPGEALPPPAKPDTDPQLATVRVAAFLQSGEPVLIDVGSGKGRLFAAFDALDDSTVRRISYRAVDIDRKALDELKKRVEEEGLASRFRSFSAHPTVAEIRDGSLAIAANVVHEVGPDRLATFFNELFRAVVVGGCILILEVLELPIGEEAFVLFGEQPLRKLLDRLVTRKAIEVSFTTHKSFGGTRLLDGRILIKEPGLTVEDSDVVAALREVVRECAERLAGHLNRSKRLSGLELAFVAHNLANAETYRQNLSK